MASIAGEAAVRIVPSVKGFHSDTKKKLEQKRVDFTVQAKVNLDNSDMAKVEAYRQAQEARPVTVKVRTDWDGFKRDLSQVEHIFKRNSFSRAIRMNIVIAGLDLLPALAYGAAGAAASLDALAKASLALPGLLAGALSSVGALGVGLHGVSDAFKSFHQDQKQVATQSRLIADGNRQLRQSYRDYGTAVRDTTREIQDLNAENRRSSLNVADAILGVQEAADRLRQGGQKTLLELRRDQLGYLQSVDRLQEVQTKAQRVSEDVAEANSKGVQGADRVADALDQISKNIEKLETDKIDKVAEAMEKLSPNAQSFIEATRSMQGQWKSLQNAVQDNLFEDLDKAILNLGNSTLPTLESGLSRVATGLNKNFRNLGESLGSDSSTSMMDKIFGNTDEGLERLSVGMKPLTDGLLRLMGESSDFLPRLGAASTKVFGRFDNWVARISGDGRLDKWIDKGLDGFTNLGNTIVNIGHSISSMSEIFDRATGNSGGFLKLLSDKSKQLADYLETPKGRNTLHDYFKQTQEFLSALRDGYQDVKPIIKDVVETAREWSLFLLNGLGVFAQMATAIEKHTGLIKPLLMLYFAKKTAQPIWEVLSSSFKNYERLVMAASNNAAFADNKLLKFHSDSLRRMRGEAVETQKAIAAVGQTAATPKLGPTAPLSTLTEAEKARRDAAGIGSGPGTLKDRLAAGEAAYLLRQDDRQRRAAALAQAGSSGPSGLTPMMLPSSTKLPQPPSELPQTWMDKGKKTNTRKQNQALKKQWAKYYQDLIQPTPSAVGTSGMGRMQGPELPPVALDEFTSKATKTDKSVKGLGNSSDATSKYLRSLSIASAASASSVEAMWTESDKGAKSVQGVGDSSSKAAPKAKSFGEAAKAAAGNVDSISSSSSKAKDAVSNAGEAAKGAKGKIAEIGTAAKEAGDKVGDAGGKAGLVGRLAGFAGALAGPAALTVGILAVTKIISVMGEAHRDAARAAKEQEDRLRSLAGTLDAVTGGFTRQTLAEMAGNAQQFTPGGGTFDPVNVNEAISRLGLNANQLFTNAGDPTRSVNFNSDIATLDETVKKQIEQSPEYQGSREAFETYGLDSLTLAKAARGDAESLAKVRQATEKPKYNAPVGGRGAPTPITIPDLADLRSSLPNRDATFLAEFLTGTQTSNAAERANILGAQQSVGKAKLTEAARAAFGSYGIEESSVLIDAATGNGVIEIRETPSPEQIAVWEDGQIQYQNNGPYALGKITIPASEVGPYLQAFAHGGLVRGPGGPRDDKILAKVSAGEHVTNAAAVQYYGQALFNDLNNMNIPRFAPGGWPNVPLKPPPMQPSPPSPPPKPVVPLPTTKPVVPLPAAAPKPAPVFPGIDGRGAADSAVLTTPPAATAAAPTMLPQLIPGGAPTMQIPAGTVLPGPRAGGEMNLQVNSIGVKRVVESMFPGITTIGGWRAEDPYPDHPSGRAVDIMIPNWDTPEGKAYGDQIKSFLQANAAQLGIESMIWQDILTPMGDPSQAKSQGRAAKQGATQGHLDHIHVLTTGGGLPTGTEKYRMPTLAGGMNINGLQALSSILPGGLASILPQLNAAGLFPGGIPSELLTNSAITPEDDENENLFSEKNITQFLSGEASRIGSTILNVGTSFLSGITGIDFGFLTNTAQTIGNAGMAAWMPKQNADGTPISTGNTMLDNLLGLGGESGGADVSGASPGTDAAGSIISSVANGVANGQLALDDPAVRESLASSGFNMGLLESANSITPEAIQAAVDEMGGMLGISKNPKAWVQAMIQAQSSGDKSGIFSTGGARGTGTAKQKAGAALSNAVRMWGVNSSGAPDHPSFAAGGGTADGMAWLSNGEFRTGPQATGYYGAGLFNALNAKAIPKGVAKGLSRSGIRGFAPGGWPLDPLAQAAGPLSIAPPPAPMMAPPPAPPAPEQAAPLSTVAPIMDAVAVPSTGGAPGPGATAPAPDPGALPSVADATAAFGGAGSALGGIGSGGVPQPGASGAAEGDPRATLGAAPVSQNHTNPAISGAISGIASAVGSAAAMAAQAGTMAGTMGASAAMPGAGGAAGAGIQAGAQMAGAIANGAVNILSSFLVGTATSGSVASASGTPMLPQRPPVQSGVPAMGGGRVHNGDIYVTDLADYRRTTERMDAQAAMPFIGKY